MQIELFEYPFSQVRYYRIQYYYRPFDYNGNFLPYFEICVEYGSENRLQELLPMLNEMKTHGITFHECTNTT